MRLIAHLSDLHFGRVSCHLLDPLRDAIRDAQPHLVAVSGDLTQRAKPAEFREARQFLDSLPPPVIVVPGNHDVPLYHVVERLIDPLARYRREITPDLTPCFADEELFVLGVNTARGLTWKNGRIGHSQIDHALRAIRRAGPGRTQVLVTHHPFDLPDSHGNRALAGRAGQALARLLPGGIDLLLAGHYHQSYAGHTALRHTAAGPAAIFVQAGTATSTRGRGEPNSFNLIRIDGPSIEVTTQHWHHATATFRPIAVERFRKEAGGWLPAAGPVSA